MNEENLVQKYSHNQIFSHYTDIMIFVLGYFNSSHPVCTVAKFVVEVCVSANSAYVK